MTKIDKILIATGIFPPDIGGPATMLSHLASDLTRRGFEVKVITYGIEAKEREWQSESTRSGGYDVCRVKKNNKLKYLWQMIKLARWADLIYATDTYSVGYFAYLMKKLLGKKYLLRFTGDSAWETARAKGWTEDYIVDFNSRKCHPDPERAKRVEGEGPREICDKIKKLKNRRNKILLNADKIIVDCEFNKKLAEKILDNCHAELVSASPYTKINILPKIPKQVRDDKKEDKIIIINNAVDFDYNVGTGRDLSDSDIDLSAKIKQKYSLHGEKIILTACRLTPWKGVDKVIEVLPELISCLQSPDWRQDVHFGFSHSSAVLGAEEIGANNEPVRDAVVSFLILGEGSEMESLKLKVKSLNLENNVHFLGKISHLKIYNYLRVADVFVLNSQYEGASHALLDAMTAGVPIITTNLGGNPELIENGKEGLLVEYGNKEELLNALARILESPSLCHSRENGNPENGAHEDLSKFLSNNAREKVKKFKWSEVVEKTQNVILSVAKDPLGKIKIKKLRTLW